MFAATLCAPRIVSIADNASRVDTNLGKAVGARNAGNPKIAGPGRDDATLFAEGHAAVMGDGHHDAVAIVPDGVERAIRANHAVKAFQSAIVIARQAGDAAQLDRL